MRKKLRIAICLLSLLLLLSCSIYGAEGQTSIAVCSFAAMSPIQPEMGSITAMLVSKTLSSNAGRRVLSPNSSASLGNVPSSDKQAIAAAKALQVEFVITGTLSDTPEGQMLDFTLWSAKTGEPVLVESIQIGPDDKSLFDGLELIDTRVRQTTSAPASPTSGRDPGLRDIPPNTRPGSVLAVGQTWWQDGSA